METKFMPQGEQPQQPRQPQQPKKPQQVNLPPFFDTFTGKFGQPLQFILIGSAILTLFFYWIVPMFEVQNEALTKIVLLISACASIFGYYSLRATAQVYTLKVASLLFMIAEVLIAIGFLAASAMSITNIAQSGVLMMLGFIIYMIASGSLLGERCFSASKSSWPVWIGAFRFPVIALLGYFFFYSLEMDPKITSFLLGAANFAITYLLWVFILAPQLLGSKK